MHEHIILAQKHPTQQFHKKSQKPKNFQKPQNLGLKCMNERKMRVLGSLPSDLILI